MDILLTHAYFLAEDAAERAIMKPYPPLGILSISAYLRSRGFAVGLFDSTFASFDEFEQALAREAPPIVGIYVNLMTRRNALRMIRASREAGALVVLGGPEPASYADEYLARGADVIVNGEGEIAAERLVAHLRARGLRDLASIPGLAFRDDRGTVVRTGAAPIVPHLDALPFPDRGAIDLDRYVRTWRTHHGRGSVSLITARGCPYTCTWCSHAVFGFSHRRRSPASVAAELDSIVRTWKPDMVWYADDVFTINKRWIQAYAEELKARGLHVPFETISREDRLDAETVRTLAAMGCFRLWIGAESGSQRVLDAMQRGTDARRMRDMIRLVRAAGIEAGTFIMLGYDGEETADIEETVRHLVDARPDHVLTTVAYPIKGTAYHARVADRTVLPVAWDEGSDRDAIVTGRHSRRYYEHARRWIASEVALARARRDPAAGRLRRWRTTLAARAGRLGMRLTEHQIEGATPPAAGRDVAIRA
jgi:radical SAM superfamily enzyme YgiQ (UPF0313 family)